MAAQNGGNGEGTVKDQAVVTDNGVTIIGYTDLAGRLPAQASQLYGTNVVNLLKLMTQEKDGQLTLDFDDVVHNPCRHAQRRPGHAASGFRQRSGVARDSAIGGADTAAGSVAIALRGIPFAPNTIQPADGRVAAPSTS